jgi:hypothetical protein
LAAGDRRRAIAAADKLLQIARRTRGRPKKAPGQKQPEIVAAHFARHGLAATLKRFPKLSPETVVRYIGKAPRSG